MPDYTNEQKYRFSMAEDRVGEHLPVMQIPNSVTIIMMICRWRWCDDRSKYATTHIKYVETFIFCIIIAEMLCKTLF